MSLEPEDEVGDEPWPKVLSRAERRLPDRVLMRWEDLREGRKFPPTTLLDHNTLREFEPYSLLLHQQSEQDPPTLARIGYKLAEESGRPDANGALSHAAPQSLLGRIAERVKDLQTASAPLRFNAEFANARSAIVIYRGILLPFSNDGQKPSHILCVITWKERADSEIAQQLQFEIERQLMRRSQEK